MLVIQNTTQQRENERLHQNEDYKNRLLASVTHDLKNPLANIIQLSQSIKNELEGLKDNGSLA